MQTGKSFLAEVFRRFFTGSNAVGYPKEDWKYCFIEFAKLLYGSIPPGVSLPDAYFRAFPLRNTPSLFIVRNKPFSQLLHLSQFPP